MPEDIIKSSAEILTELFGVFNAEPPPLLDCSSPRKDRKKSKKSKKVKKKLKSKKHKRKHSPGSDVSSSGTDEPVDKKPKVEVSVDAVPLALDLLLNDVLENTSEIPDATPLPEKSLAAVKIKIEPTEVNIKKEPSDSFINAQNELIKEEKNPNDINLDTAHIEEREKLSAVFGTTNPPIADDSTAEKKRKILLPSLKNSSVFQETVKAVEEKKKEEEDRKAKFEEGELTDSSQSSSDEKDCLEGKSKKHKSSRKKRSSSQNGRRGDRKRRHKSRSRSGSRSKHRPRESRSDRSRDDTRYNPYYADRSRDSSSRRRSEYASRSGLASHSARSSRSRRDSSRERHRRTDTERKRSSSKESRRHRSKSKDKRKSRDRSKSRERRKSKDRSKSRERQRSKDKSDYSLHSKEKGADSRIDKKKLLAIARKNAVKLVEAGIVAADNLRTITSHGKTVNELTEYCKKLSTREAGGEVSEDESESSDNEDVAFHHPFQVRDRPNSIVMNIRNSVALPVRSLQEKAVEQSKILRLTYPVSSGSTHRANESEWVPVEPTPKLMKTSAGIQPKPVEPLLPPPPFPPLPPLPDDPPRSLSAVPPPTIPAPVVPVLQPAAQLTPDEIPEPTSDPAADISAIVSKRLDALRALHEDPSNRSAKVQVSRTERQLDHWVKLDSKKPRSKVETGAFTGSTGARVLTPQQLGAGPQAWAKRDQLVTALPVTGGMGMALLQKMGWQPGEGLGKNKEGSLEPLKLEVKTDKKGLVAYDEASWGSKTPNHVGPALPTVKTLDGKHPVSLLNEYCNRRRWALPKFDLAFECGPDHKKNFLFKVIVNGKEYKPTVASVNKKQAKAEAAAICLRALGLISTIPT